MNDPKYMSLIAEFEDVVSQLHKLDYFDKRLLSSGRSLTETTNDKTRQFEQIIKELKTIISRYKNEAQFYSSILDHQQQLTCHLDSKLTVTYANQFFCKFFNQSPAQIKGQSFKNFIQDAEALNILNSQRTVEFYTTYEHEAGDKTFSKRLILWRVCPLADSSYIANGYDITSELKLKEAISDVQRKIQTATTLDDITGLPNRQAFVQRLHDEIDRSRRYGLKLALLLLDLDNFKKINDSLGHKVGDTLLVAVSQRIRGLLRTSDVISRIGGDEFAVLLPSLNLLEGAGVVANKILNSFVEPFKVSDLELYLTASIGVAIYPDDGQDVETLFKNADAAMYEVKKSDKNSFRYYDSQINALSFEKLKIENELRRAIENNEFVLFFQPQLDIKTGKVIGAEALIRWIKPGVGLIPPMKFIPVAEESNLIIPISEWVIKTASATMKSWLEAGLPPITVAVNISMKHFRQPNLFELIANTLQSLKIPPTSLEIELTESILMHDTGAVIKLLSKFRELGLHISIDDFGTGFSSLNYLKKLPITKLKIDQSFVRNITVDKKDAMIVKTIIEMAHNLDLKVIAEGVETLEHSEFLRQLNCDELQGYFFSKPLPQDDFEQLWQTLLLLG